MSQPMAAILVNPRDPEALPATVRPVSWSTPTSWSTPVC